MKMLCRGFLAACLAYCLAAPLIAPAGASAFEWQADRSFWLLPDPFPGPTDGATTARYRLLDPQGNPLQSPTDQPVIELLKVVEVPPVPGVYTLEAWLEDASGQELRRGTATLRFDDVVPPPPTPEAPERWLLGIETAVLKVGTPAGTPPLSGIRGYAVSVDRGSGSSPCAGANACAVAEVDLASGANGGSLSLGTLPEGTTFARVVSVSGSGVPSRVETVAFKVDATAPSVSLTGAPSGWSNGPVRVTAVASDTLSGMEPAGSLGPFTAIVVDGGSLTVAAGATATRWIIGSGVHTVESSARDAAGNVAGGGPGAPPAAKGVVRIDEEAPRVLFAPAQDSAEPERIEATVTDPLSGPSSDRGSIGVRLAGTRARFEQLPTRMADDRLIAHWDSDAYPPGKYEFLATGFDLAGNAGVGTDRARGGSMVLVNPLKTPVSLHASLSGKRLLGGRLQRLGGPPVAAAEIAVTETFVAGSQLAQRRTLLRTRPDGTFSLRLAPGPSREVVAAFAGTRGLTKAVSAKADLPVASAVRLRASAATAAVGGKPIVFSGKVTTTGVRRAARGLPVELQFRYRGGSWNEFRTVEADARGRFRYAYGFSDDDSRGVRFQFRAYVNGREGWPYEPGASRPVVITGR